MVTPEVLHAGSGQYLDWGGRIEAVFAFARIWRIMLHGGQQFTFGMHRTGVWTGAGTASGLGIRVGLASAAGASGWTPAGVA